jgi:hypothetical protein
MLRIPLSASVVDTEEFFIAMNVDSIVIPKKISNGKSSEVRLNLNFGSAKQRIMSRTNNPINRTSATFKLPIPIGIRGIPSSKSIVDVIPKIASRPISGFFIITRRKQMAASPMSIHNGDNQMDAIPNSRPTPHAIIICIGRLDH